MSLQDQLELARAKMIRYRVLKILDAGRPYPVGESLIVEVLDDVDLAVTRLEARRALRYLSDKGYIEVVIREPQLAGVWESRLLPPGVDYLENPRAEDAGIARPGDL